VTRMVPPWPAMILWHRAGRWTQFLF